MTIEYRIGWSVKFQGAEGVSEWAVFDGEATTEDGAREEIQRTGGGLSRLLEEAVEEAGFGCWVETRESPAKTGSGT